MSAEKALEDLLASLFDSSELRRFIYHLPPSGKAIAKELPENLAIAELAHQAVRALQRHMMIDDQFFGSLCYERPVLAEKIKGIGERWRVNSRQRPDGEGASKAYQGSAHQGQSQKTTQTSTPSTADLLAVAGLGAVFVGGIAVIKTMLSNAAESERLERYILLLEDADDERLLRLLRSREVYIEADDDLPELVANSFILGADLLVECFTSEQLRALCAEFQISKYGTKYDMADRIAYILDIAE